MSANFTGVPVITSEDQIVTSGIISLVFIAYLGEEVSSQQTF